LIGLEKMYVVGHHCEKNVCCETPIIFDKRKKYIYSFVTVFKAVLEAYNHKISE